MAFCCPDATSQRRIVESLLPVTSQRPSAENAADPTAPALCAINRANDLRPAKSHKMTVLSVELVAMIWPSEEMAMNAVAFESVMVDVTCLVARFHKLRVLPEAVAKTFVFAGEKASALMSSVAFPSASVANSRRFT